MDQETLMKVIENLTKRVQALETNAVSELHTHNGVDSQRVRIAEAADVNIFGKMGVITEARDSVGVSGPQTFDGGVVSYPIPIIVGYGVGGASAFAGGSAPNGTMIMFTNGPTLSGLQIMFDDQWYTINIDAIA